ncbi:hypothetical protein ACTA71_001591 [Dictyostelium dimigraforme]
MKIDRAFGDWNEGGIKPWDIEQRQTAFKIWYLNRLLHTNFSNECNISKGGVNLKTKKARSESLYRQNFHPIHNKLTTLPDSIKPTIINYRNTIRQIASTTAISLGNSNTNLVQLV